MDGKSVTVESRDYCTVMAHFYRGELGRIMEWRRRLDVTTNWAIMGATALITFGFGSAEHFSLPFVFANYLVFLLLVIEARRYRIYDAFRARVRALELNFILPVMKRETELSPGGWEETLEADLRTPGPRITAGKAIRRRFRRNYVWIFLLIAAAWSAKIWFHHHRAPAGADLFQVIGAPGSLSGAPFWVLAGLIYAVLIGMAAAAFLFGKDSFQRSCPPPGSPNA